MRVGPKGGLSCKELMLLNCGTREYSLRVLWIARTSSQSILRKINPEIFIGRADYETEAPKLWPPDAKSQLIGKDSDAGKV